MIILPGTMFWYLCQHLGRSLSCRKPDSKTVLVAKQHILFQMENRFSPGAEIWHVNLGGLEAKKRVQFQRTGTLRHI